MYLPLSVPPPDYCSRVRLHGLQERYFLSVLSVPRKKNIDNFLWCDKHRGILSKQYSSLPSSFHLLLQISGILWDNIHYGDKDKNDIGCNPTFLNLTGKPAFGQFIGMPDTIHFDIPQVLLSNITGHFLVFNCFQPSPVQPGFLISLWISAEELSSFCQCLFKIAPASFVIHRLQLRAPCFFLFLS